MISEASALSRFCSRYAFWKPTFMICPRLRMSRITAVGISRGRSMWTIFWRMVAPSMRAASYSVGSMPASTAR